MTPSRSHAPRKLSRRELITGVFARFAPHPSAPVASGVALPGSHDAVPADTIAHILPRSCLAWRNLVCTTCVERCPIPGAILFREGKPFINGSMCDGCGVCRDTCPAPRNAVAMLPRRAKPGEPQPASGPAS